MWACAVCRTDLHVVDGDLPPRRAAIVPGRINSSRAPGTESRARARGPPGRCRCCRPAQNRATRRRTPPPPERARGIDAIAGMSGSHRRGSAAPAAAEARQQSLQNQPPESPDHAGDLLCHRADQEPGEQPVRELRPSQPAEMAAKLLRSSRRRIRGHPGRRARRGTAC